MNPAPEPASFDAALAGARAHLVRDDGGVLAMASQRWQRPADREDRWMLDRCGGPTVDVGCGPGRLVTALVERGVPALGVDCSPSAVRQTHSRGGLVLWRDVFDRLPGEGRWHHVLLADGNIGIGGDPLALLRRCAALLGRGGTLLVETARPGAGLWRGQVRLVADPAPEVATNAVPGTTSGAAGGAPFPWAVLGPAELAALAEEAGLRVLDHHQGARCFVELHHGSAPGMSADGKRRRTAPDLASQT